MECMIKLFKKYLDTQDIEYKTLLDSLISFELEDLNYLFFSDSDDINYFRLFLPKIDDYPKDESQQKKIDNIVNMINSSYRVVKVIILEESVWLCIEQFVYSTQDINEIFKISIEILKVAIERYRNLINE